MGRGKEFLTHPSYGHHSVMPLSIFAAPAVRSWAAAGVGGGNVGLGRARAVGWVCSYKCRRDGSSEGVQ